MSVLPRRSEPCVCGEAIPTWDLTHSGITKAVDLHNRGESHRAWRNARELDLLADSETFGRLPTTAACSCGLTCPHGRPGASSAGGRRFIA